MKLAVTDKQYLDYCNRLLAYIRTVPEADLAKLVPSINLIVAQATRDRAPVATSCLRAFDKRTDGSLWRAEVLIA